jgi:asparagine synthase (glutamine-hydrolysing)
MNHSNPSSLWLGSPRFNDPSLAAIAQREGPLAAWQCALEGGAQAAARAARGEFAVALTLPGGRVFLAVDRFASRTLCYRRIGERLHFSASAAELAALDPVAEIDPQALYDYLYFHAIPSPRTVFNGVYRLPPSHCALFDGGALHIEPYWSARFSEPARGEFEPLAAEFRALLEAAVAEHLDGSKAACYLSGGTDSSTIAGLIGKVAGRAAATYSIGFDAAGYDEMAYARIAAKRFGTEHHEYYVTPDDLVRGIPQVAAFYDQPFGNSSALPAYYCARMARDDGVTRLLAGDGGDELFGGNVRYAKQRVFGWYDNVPAPVRRGVMEPLLEGTPLGRLPLLRKGASYIDQAKLPLPDRLQQYNLLLRLGTDEVLAPGLQARIDAGDPLRQQREVWQAAQAGAPINRMLAYDWRYTLSESDLPKVIGTSTLAGVSVGFPFLDTRLLDFSLGLPPQFKLKGLKLRWFFKEALRGFLPDEIIAKKKHGFGLPFGVWASTHAPLNALASDSLRSLAGRGVVQPRFVERLLTDHLPAHPGYYGEMVWILMMLEQWLRSHRPEWRL